MSKVAFPLFFSYAHEDEPTASKFKKELGKHLAAAASFDMPLRYDLDLLPGERWRDSLNEWLDEVEGGILCISPSFLSSSFCQEVELRRLLERRKLLFPILLDHVSFERQDLGLLKELQIFGENPPFNDRPFKVAANKGTFAFRAFEKIHERVSRRYERVRLKPWMIKRAVDAVKEDLSPKERGLLDTLGRLLRPNSTDAAVESVLLDLFAKTDQSSQDNLRQIRSRLQTSASAIGLRVATDDELTKSLGERRLWIEAYRYQVEEWMNAAAASSLLGHPSREFVPPEALSLETRPFAGPRRVAFLYDSSHSSQATEFCQALQAGLPALRDESGDPMNWELIEFSADPVEERTQDLDTVRQCDPILVWLTKSFFESSSPLRRLVFDGLLPMARLVAVHGGGFDDRAYELHNLDRGRIVGRDLVVAGTWSNQRIAEQVLGDLRSGGRSFHEITEAQGAVLVTAADLLERPNELLRKEEAFVANVKHGLPGPFVCPLAQYLASLDSFDPDAPTPKGTDALALLKNWRDDPSRSLYYAVLGELGIGKTTLLRQFAWESRRDREVNPRLPLIVYLDLRDYSPTVQEHHRVPDTKTLLQELLDSGWKGRLDQRLSADELIDLIDGGGILIMDGLDEKLTHLSPHQAQAFIRNIWAIAPPFRDEETSERTSKGRIIVSCRTHFFASLKEQSLYLKAQLRDNVKSTDYEAIVLLPFTEEQIREYLQKVLGVEKGQAALETMRSIHDLMELGTRPVLLSYIAPEIGRLEARRAQGRPVKSIDLYRDLVSSWIERDAGKHQILTEDKRRLMPRLAVAMWSEGARQWSWDKLSVWFRGQITSDPTLVYNLDRVPVLLEDLRNATFVVRNESDDSFRFAHTSLLEFFLAQALLDELETPGPGWYGPMPSDEAFGFLSEMLEEVPARREGIINFLESPSRAATKAALRYFLLAREKGWPLRQPAKFELAGQDLVRWRFRGKKQARLDLRRADLLGADLTATEWTEVDLSGSRLDEANASGATFDRTVLTATTAHALCKYMTISRRVADAPKELRDQTLVAPLKGDDRAILASGHRNSVSSVAFSPDGERIVSGSYDKTLILWDTKTGNALKTLEGHRNSVQSVAFSPDGERIVSGSRDNTLILWDAKTGNALKTLEGHRNWVQSVAFSPDGERIVSGSRDNTLILWDAKTGNALKTLEGHRNPIISAVFSPDGERIASGSYDGTLILWDAKTGNALKTLEGHRNSVSSVAFSPDGERIVSGSYDNTLILWDAKTGNALKTLEGHRDSVYSVAFSPHGERIVSGSDDNTLILWDAKTGNALKTLEGHRNSVSSVAFSPHGERIVSGSYDKTLILWDAKTGNALKTLEGHRNPIISAVFSPNGERIASGSSDNTLILWDAKTGNALKTLEGHRNSVSSVAFSPHGERIVSGSYDKTLILWDTKTGNALKTLEGHRNSVSSVAFSPDGERIVSGSYDNTLILWDAKTGNALKTLEGHRDSVYSVAFSPHGERIVSGSDDNTLILWDAKTGNALKTLEGHRNSVYSVAFSPHGERIVSGSDDNTLILWDAKTGNALKTLEGHRNSVLSVAFSPDGERIVSGSYDKTLILWDTKTGNALKTLEGHRNPIISAVFSPDGERIASGSYDGTLILWDAKTGETLTMLVSGGKDTRAAYDYRTDRFLYLGDESWRAVGIVADDENGWPRWFMPEVALRSL